MNSNGVRLPKFSRSSGLRLPRSSRSSGVQLRTSSGSSQPRLRMKSGSSQRQLQSGDSTHRKDRYRDRRIRGSRSDPTGVKGKTRMRDEAADTA
ncbi:MAG TPA: hypothetical protein VIK40_06500 [Geomonas sp.]